MKKSIMKKVALSTVLLANVASASGFNINGDEVREKEIIEISKQYLREDYLLATKEEQEEMIKKIIDLKIVIAEAEEMNLSKSEEYKEAMKYMGTLRLIQLYYEKKYESFQITDRHIEEYYIENEKIYTEERTINASHILVPQEKQAIELIGQLKEAKNIKKKFTELAKEHSIGPSGKSGGELGWFKRGQMVEGFEKASYGLKKGEYTKEPVKTSFGYHIILINDEKIKRAKSIEELKEDFKKDPTILKKYKEKLFEKEAKNRLEKLKTNKYKINIIK